MKHLQLVTMIQSDCNIIATVTQGETKIFIFSCHLVEVITNILFILI